MSESHSTDHVLTLKDIEYERDVAMKASLTGSIEYVRMARQIEAAVVAKVKTADMPFALVFDILGNILARIPAAELKRMALVSAADVADREVAAFVAGNAWMRPLRDHPSLADVEAEAALRYLPKQKPAEAPTVTLSTGTWRRTTTGWQRLMPFTGVKPNKPDWQFNMSQPECRTAEDYNTIATYLTELVK